MNNNITTPFSVVYDDFLTQITDDMYMELTELDTYRLLQELLLKAIIAFKFPRVNLNDNEIFEAYDMDTYQGVESGCDENGVPLEVPAIIYGGGQFNFMLTDEEIHILALNMVIEWFSQQLASIENVRMKYSGSDFKFTSQANHMQKVLALKKHYEEQSVHFQNLYKRRKREADGVLRTTMGTIMDTPYHYEKGV